MVQGDRQTDTEAAREKRRMRRARPGKADYFHRYWRDWLTDAAIRALSREERAGWADVECQTWATATPGLYTEDQLRAWAGYTEEEWPRHRARFLALHRVLPTGLWVRPPIRAEALATQTRLRRNRKRAQEAARKSWNDRRVHATSNAPSNAPSMPTHPTQDPSVRGANSSLPTPFPGPEGGEAGTIAGEVLARMGGAFGGEGSPVRRGR